MLARSAEGGYKAELWEKRGGVMPAAAAAAAASMDTPMADATAADPPLVSAAAATPAPAAAAVDGVTKATAATAPAPHAPPTASGPGRLPLPGLRRKPPPVTIPNVNDGNGRGSSVNLLSAAVRTNTFAGTCPVASTAALGIQCCVRAPSRTIAGAFCWRARGSRWRARRVSCQPSRRSWSRKRRQRSTRRCPVP